MLKCKTSINKILFSVEKLFIIMFVIFSLVRKIIKLIFQFTKKIGSKKKNQLLRRTDYSQNFENRHTDLKK